MKIITVIPDSNNGYAKQAKSKNHSESKVFGIDVNSSVKAILFHASKFAEKSFGISKIYKTHRKAKAMSVLPFRVRFTNLANIGYSPENPAPIGIAVIERNNYVF